MEASWNRTIIIGCGVVVGIGPVARRARTRREAGRPRRSIPVRLSLDTGVSGVASRMCVSLPSPVVRLVHEGGDALLAVGERREELEPAEGEMR